MNKDKHRNIWMKRIKDKRNFVRKVHEMLAKKQKKEKQII